MKLKFLIMMTRPQNILSEHFVALSSLSKILISPTAEALAAQFYFTSFSSFSSCLLGRYFFYTRSVLVEIPIYSNYSSKYTPVLSNIAIPMTFLTTYDLFTVYLQIFEAYKFQGCHKSSIFAILFSRIAKYPAL